jgi:putative membrane protein
MFNKALTIVAAIFVATAVMAVQAEPMKPSTVGEALIPNNDKTFFENAASAGMFEVEAGKLAAARGTDPKIKQFGEMMVKDHTKANEELKALAAKKNVTLPAELARRHQFMLDEIKDEKDGKEFDQAFKRAMVVSHKEAVTLFSNTAKHSKDPDVKAFATKTLPALEQHGGEAKNLP